MAEAAAAYVTIRPDLKFFAEELRTKLAGIGVSYNLPVKVDADQARRALISAMSDPGLTSTSKKLGSRVGRELSEGIGSTVKPRVRAVAKETENELDALGKRLARIKLPLPSARNPEVERFRANLRLSMQHTAEDAANELRKGFAVGLFKLSDTSTLRALEKSMTQRFGSIGTQAARSLFRSLEQEARAAENLGKKITPLMVLQMRHAAEDAAHGFRDAFRRGILDIRDEPTLRRVEHEMTARFGTIGSSVARSMINAVKKETGGSGLSQAFMRMSQVFTSVLPTRRSRFMGARLFSGLESGLTSFGQVIGKLQPLIEQAFLSIGNVVAKGAQAVTNFTITSGVSFTGLGNAVQDSMTKAGAGVASFLGSLENIAGPIGAVVVAIVAFGVASSVVVGLLAALQTGVAALALGFVALVAAIYAAVGAVGLLIAGIGGLVAVVPAGLTSLGGALAVLAFAWNKINDEFQKSGKGSLHDFTEHLKNAVVAAMQFEPILSKVLALITKFFPAIAAVAGAWGLFFTQLVKVASTPQIINAINLALGAMATVVIRLIPLIQPLLDIFLRLSSAGQPAVLAVVDAVVRLITWLDKLIVAAQQSGALAAFFSQVGQILSSVVMLAQPLTTLITGFMAVALPGFQTLVNLLALVFQRWSDILNSAQGQTFLADFFDSTMHILVAFIPLIEQVLKDFMRLAPTFESLFSVASPILTLLSQTIADMVINMGPGLTEFLTKIGEILNDPAVQQGLMQFATALGELVASLATFNAADVADFLGFMVELTHFAVELMHALSQLLPLLLASMKTTLMFVQILAAPIQMLGELVDKLGNIKDKLPAVAKGLTVLTGAIGQIPGAGNLVEGFTKKLLGIGPAAQTAAATTDNALRGLNNSAVWGSLAGKAAGLAGVIATVGNVVSGIRGFAANVVSQIQLKQSLDAFKKGFAAPLDTGKAAGSEGVLGDIIPDDLHGKAFDTARELAFYIAKGIVAGTSKVNAAVNKMLSNRSIKAALTSLATAVIARDKVIADIEIQNKKLQDLLNAKEQFRDALRNTLLTARDLTNAFQGFTPDPSDVVNALQQSFSELTKFVGDVDALAAKGFGKDLIAQLSSAGVAGGSGLAAGLRSATPEQVRQINALFAQIDNTATGKADSLSNSMYDTGIAAVQGLIKGLNSQQAQLTGAINNMVKSIVTSTKRALGVKSPSTVFFGIGQDTMDGYVLGLQNGLPQAASTLSALSNIRPGFGSAAFGAPGFGQLNPTFATRVFIGDKELKTMIRTEVDQTDQDSAAALLYGRRFG